MPGLSKGKGKEVLGEKDKIPITSAQQLQEELRAFKTALSVQETEHTWQAIDKAVKRYTAVTRGGGCRFEDEYLQGLKDRELARAIIGCLSTERTQLSASTLLFVSAATRLGYAFGPLINIYLPHLLRLLSRTNKLYISRATSCLVAIIRNTRLASVIPFLREGMDEKSVSHRKGCLLGILAVLGGEEGFEQEEGILVDKEVVRRRYLDDIETCIKIGARDRDIDIRKTAKKAWLIYRREFGERVQSFAAPLTPTIRKYLDLPPPGQAMPTFSANVPSSQFERPVSRPVIHQVSRPAPPPRAPSPTKSAAASRPASRTAELGKSTSSSLASSVRARETSGDGAIHHHQQILPKPGSRPPSRQAVPGPSMPNPLSRSASASGPLQTARQAEPHAEVGNGYPSNRNPLARSVTYGHIENADLNGRVGLGASQSSVNNGARIFAAAAHTANLNRVADGTEQQAESWPGHSRATSRDAIALGTGRPIANGPRRAGAGHYRIESAQGETTAPALPRARAGRAFVVPEQQPQQPFEAGQVAAPSQESQRQEAIPAEAVPQKRSASAMSTTSATSVVLAPRRERTPVSVSPPPELAVLPSEALDTPAFTSEVQPSAQLSSTDAVLAAPLSESSTAKAETSAPPAVATSSLSASCPPSASTFAPQPPPPTVNIAALAAQLPQSNVHKAGRQAFRPARPNISQAGHSQPSQVRKVPSALSVKQAGPAPRSISASAAVPPVMKAHAVSLKDSLAHGRAQASASAASRSKATASLQTISHAPPLAKRQALSSSTSSTTTGRTALSSSTSSSTSTKSSVRTTESKGGLTAKPQGRAPPFKPTQTASSAKPRPPASQGSIFSRLTAPTASSAARARAVSGSNSSAANRTASKVKETFKKPGMPSSKSVETMAHPPPVPQPISLEASEGTNAAELPSGEVPISEGVSVSTLPEVENVEEQRLAEKDSDEAAGNRTVVEAAAIALPDTPIAADAAIPRYTSETAGLADGITVRYTGASAPSVPTPDVSIPDQIWQVEAEPIADAVSPCMDEGLDTLDALPGQSQKESSELQPDSGNEMRSADAVSEAQPEHIEGISKPAMQEVATVTRPHDKLDSLQDLLAATIESLSLGNSTAPDTPAPHSPEVASTSPIASPPLATLDHGIFATARKAGPGVNLPDPSSSILFSPSKTSGTDGLLFEDEPSHLVGEDTVIEQEAPHSRAVASEIGQILSSVPDRVPDTVEQISGDSHTHAVVERGASSDAQSQSDVQAEEEEDDFALLISRELSDDSLEELASRFESSRIFASGEGMEGADWDEDIENTPVRPRLLTRSIGAGSGAGSSEPEDEDDTEVLTMRGKDSGRKILAGLSKTPMPAKGQSSALDEWNILRTL